MSAPQKHRFLKLMRMERVLPADIQREKLAVSNPKELLQLLSFAEFLQLKEEITAWHNPYLMTPHKAAGFPLEGTVGSSNPLQECKDLSFTPYSEELCSEH